MKKNNYHNPFGIHYTLQDEYNMEKAIEEANKFMENYGKGMEPLLAGHPISRRVRTKKQSKCVEPIF